MTVTAKPKRILSIDIGGTGLKAGIIDPKGRLLTKHLRVETPHPCPPAVLVKALAELVRPLKNYDHVAAGFPGVVKEGRIITAPHLGTDIWAGFHLERALAKKLGKPTRIANDADVQGLAVIKGRGLEFVITLGTGYGTALFRNGELMPHMEIAHLPFRHNKTYDDYLGDHTLKRIGRKKWNKRVEEALPFMRTMLNYDHLFIGGGNAKKISCKLPPHTTIVSNNAGIEGGAGLWCPPHRK